VKAGRPEESGGWGWGWRWGDGDGDDVDAHEEHAEKAFGVHKVRTFAH